MAKIETLVKTRDLDFSRFLKALESEAQFYIDYDSESDILFLRLDPAPGRTIVHYVEQFSGMEEYVGLHYDPDTMVVVGLQIEAFEHSYVSAHGLSDTWSVSEAELDSIADAGDVIERAERKKRDLSRDLVRHSNLRGLVPA